VSVSAFFSLLGLWSQFVLEIFPPFFFFFPSTLCLGPLKGVALTSRSPWLTHAPPEVFDLTVGRLLRS